MNTERVIKTPVRYATHDESDLVNGFIFDADDVCVFDFVWQPHLNEAGAILALCINDHARLVSELERVKGDKERLEAQMATIRFMASGHPEPDSHCVLCVIEGHANDKLQPIALKGEVR